MNSIAHTFSACVHAFLLDAFLQVELLGHGVAYIQLLIDLGNSSAKG